MKRRPAALALAVGLALASCGGRATPESHEGPLVEALRFSHPSHAGIACTDCHAPRPERFESLRPGHASCDGEHCHRASFRGPTTELCALCHEGVDSSTGGESPLLPYPPTRGARAQASTFSHRNHLDADRMEALLGFHVSCTDCHAIERPETDTVRALRTPQHADCARCHAPESAPAGTPAMDDCLGCHRLGKRAITRERSFITGDLQFTHGLHRHDRRGALISCATCHQDSIAAGDEKLGEHAAPNMRACVGCHDDRERVPQSRRMRSCETCHSTRSAGLGAIAPRSHMPATERPANHTQAFQRDHGDDARADASQCARCHTMLSGNRRDTCDECHQVMRPRDHTVTWREYDHGPEAATEPERCTTCHQVDFCVTCHRNRPRSHFPSFDFRLGGHGTQAVLNLRSCITCHQPSHDCSGAGCHRSGAL